MRFFFIILFLITNYLSFSQGFDVVCSSDTIRGNHGEYENDDSLTFCAYRLSDSSNLLPKIILEKNDSIVNKYLNSFFKYNNVETRDYLIIENDKFEKMKSNGMGWISKERCAKNVKYAVRYQIWIYGNIRYFFSIHYDNSFTCLNISDIITFSRYFNLAQLKDFCTIKSNAERDFKYRGKVKEATFSFDNNKSLWIFEKDGPPLNTKTLKGYNFILIYDANTGKLIKRKKLYYESCEPCPANFW